MFFNCNPTAPARRTLRCAASGALLTLLLAALVVACGGGDPEDNPDVPTPGVDCQKEPAKCK